MVDVYNVKNRWCHDSQNLSLGFVLLSGGMFSTGLCSITPYQSRRCKYKCINAHCVRDFAANSTTLAVGAKQHPSSHLRREEATAKLLRKVTGSDRLPLCSDIVFLPNPRLFSRQPIWLNQHAEDMAAIAARCAEWKTTDPVNHSLMVVPSVWPPGHDLP